MADAASSGGSKGLDRGTILALVAMGLGVFLIANDFTALSVALPNIEKDFDTDVSTVQWVINGYALVFGVLIVSGGRLADMFGRRKLFFIGAGIFALFSAVAAVAPSIGVLLAARALMGVGGAIMWPAVLGMTFAAMPAEKKGLAGGLIIGVAGIGNAFGPLLGGFLTDAASWRWVFVINIPVAIFACVVTYLYIHQPFERNEDDRIDYWGVTTLSVGLVSLLVALDIVPTDGWGSATVIALLALFVLMMVAFAFVERRMGLNALVPPDVMSNVNFTSACIAVLLLSPTFFAVLVYLPQFFQKLLEYDALKSGLAFLPFMATFAATSFVSGTLYERFGAKKILTIGAVLECIGILLLSLLDNDWGYVDTLPGLVVLGIGVGLFISTVTTAAVTSLSEARASLGGAILYMFQVAGGSVGLGLTTTIFASAAFSKSREDLGTIGAGLTNQQLADAQGILSGVTTPQQVHAEFAPAVVSKIEAVVADAFAHGIHVAFTVDFALAVAGTVVTVLFVGGRLIGRHRHADAAAAEPASSA